MGGCIDQEGRRRAAGRPGSARLRPGVAKHEHRLPAQGAQCLQYTMSCQTERSLDAGSERKSPVKCHGTDVCHGLP